MLLKLNCSAAQVSASYVGAARDFYKKIVLLFCLFIIGHNYAQIPVTITGHTNTTPNLATNYSSFGDALTALNGITGMTGPVTLTLDAGASETAPPKGFSLGNVTLNPLLSAANTITITKAAGPATTINAGVGTSNGPTATPDGMFYLLGADYVTIDGLTFTDGNAATATVAMEFGVAFFKRTAGDGCNFNTIQNCIFNMQRVNTVLGTTPNMSDGSCAIQVLNRTPSATTNLTATNGGTLSTNGTNSNNKFYNNTINNGHVGIYIRGYTPTTGRGPNPDPATFPGDLNNDIGGNSSATGNTVLNYGGGGIASAAVGIRVNNQWGVNISFNTVNNNNGSGINHTRVLRGILAEASVSANAEISNNSIEIHGGGTTHTVMALESAMGGTPLNNTVNINNNTITGTYSTATSGLFYGIYNNNVSPATLNLSNNLIEDLTYGGTTGSGNVYPIYTTGASASSTFNILDNTVNNISRVGTTGGTTIGIFVSSGSNNMTINVNDNTVSNMSISGSGTASVMYGIQVPTGTLSVNNNLIHNLTCVKTTGTGEMNGIRSVTAPNNETYNNNTIHSIIHNGTGPVYGFHFNTTTGTRTVSGNTIHNLSTNGITISGLRSLLSSPNIFQNKIYNITSNSSLSTTLVSGILVESGNTVNIFNNLIADLKAPNASTIEAIRGINMSNAVTNSSINVSHNTVLLNASSIGANFGTTGVFHIANATATTTNLTLRNNVIVNNSSRNGAGRTVAFRRSSGGANMLNNYNAASNNNLFYAGTPGLNNLIYFDGIATAETLADYQNGVFSAGTIAPRDAQSVTENPTFQSTDGSSADFLKYDLLIPTQIESGGAPVVGVTTDFIGTIRNATSPDIGAWELDGVPLDLTPPNINYTPLSGVCGGVNNFWVDGFEIEDTGDGSSVNTNPGTRPRLYFKKSTDANDVSAWKFVEASNTSSPFEFDIDFTLLNAGGVSLNDQIQYFIVAQDQGPNVPSPNVGINSGSFANAPLSVNLTSTAFPIGGNINAFLVQPCQGTVTVGSGGNFPSLTNDGGLFEAINNTTLTGHLIAEITSDLTGELGTHALNEWTETGVGNYTLTIRPDNSTDRLIQGSYVGANAANAGLFRINGADRVIIDGRNPADLNAGGKHLIFRNQNNNNSAFNSTFTLINDATNDTLRYIVVEGATLGTTNGIIRIGTADAGDGNDFNAITNTVIRARTDASTFVTNGIFALGTFNKDNDNILIKDNEFVNIWSPSASSNGINISDRNTDFTIDGNSFYQTATRTATSASIVHAGIRVGNTTGGNFLIENNYIGGSEVDAGGAPFTQNGNVNATFIGISVSASTGSSNLIQNNVVRNITWWCSNNATVARPGIFTGIYVLNGGHEILDNEIGSDTGTDHIVVRTTSSNASTFGIAHGGSSGTLRIEGNKVGGITVQGSTTTINHNFFGIVFSQAGSATVRNINDNLIGSLTTQNSINASNNATGTAATAAQRVYGIQMLSGANQAVISGNTVANLNNNYIGSHADGRTVGISATSGSNTITDNVIFNIASSSALTSTGSGAAVVGLSLTATAANAHLISRNTIYSVRSTAASASAQVIGLYYGSSTGTTNQVSRNIVHSLGTNSTAASGITGIYLGAGNVTLSNNMIRLGIDAGGNDLSASHIYNGIIKDNTSNNNRILYNSVYIGGEVTGSGFNSTYAFRRLQAGTGDLVRNNIFYNARSNSSSGGNHYGVFLNNSNTLTMSHNIILTDGTGGIFGRINTTNYNDLASWQSSTSFGNSTLSADPNFVDATSGVPNLRLVTGVLSPAESAALEIAGLTDDIDTDNIRTGYPQTSLHGGGTAPDIGAHETDMIPQDLTPPSFSYTFIPSQSSACDPIITSVNVTITDTQSGISLIDNLPRMYFRRSVGSPTTSWSVANSVQGTLVSGNSNNSVWNFTITYADFGIVPATSNVFEYYFVAQDQATIPNIGVSQSNSSSPVHSDVNTLVTAPNFSFGASGTYSFAAPPLSGTVTVGSGGNFPSFNANPGGLFNAINTRGLSGDLEVLVISNINESANWTPLNAPQEFCGSNYTITIRPNASVNYTIQSNTFGANPLIHFLGTKRLIIDGSFDGSGKFLTFRQSSTQTCIGSSNPTFYFSGTSSSSASEIEIRNCIIEGNNRLTACIGPGVLNFGNLLSTGQGMNNIIIDNNIIRNRSDLTQTPANTPNSLIQIGAPNSVGIPRSNIQITNNEFLNFSESAIQIRQNNSGQGIGNGFVISGNKIYQEYSIPTYQYPIWLEGGLNSHSHVISNNLIGGNSSPNPDITGTWLNNKVDGEVQAIYVLVGGTNNDQATSIQGNKIQNFNISGTGWTNFVGIRVERGRVRIGDEVGNVIGSEDNSLDNIISNGSGGSFITEDAAVIGIWTQSSEEVVIENNTISGLSTGLGTFCFFDGIAHGSNMFFNGIQYSSPGGKSTIRNNTIANNRSSSNLQNSTVSNEGMISLFVYTNSMENLVEGNVIQNNGVVSIVNANIRNHGVLLGILGQIVNHGGIFRNNTIAALANGAAGTAPEINGLVLNHGNWNVSNNMISLRNGTTGTHINSRNTLITGIRDHLRNLTGQGANYIHNSVYIYGTNGGSGTGNPSYNYLRIPNNAGNVAGAPTTMRNNLFINERIGLGTHRALGNINTGSPATGWNSSASDFNFIATLTANTATRWGLTDLNLAGWQTNSGGDANSAYIPVAASTIANVQLDPEDLFESDFLFGNLRISLLNADAMAFIEQQGTATSILDDIDGNSRNPLSPDIGAHEFTSLISLPVELTNLSANCLGDEIQINWTTASELNASHYILQSSRDGQTWLHLTQINAAGTTNQTSNYSHSDQNFGGLTYYRLLQVDLDGQQTIYGPISSNCDLQNSLMTVYPNPASESFTLMLQSSENIGSAQVDLVDMSGRVILSQIRNINAGSTMLNFDVQSIQPGAYMIRVKGENDKFAPIRVVKL